MYNSSYQYSKTAYKYDTLTDTYTKLADIPNYFYMGVAEAIGNYVYIIGGAYTSSIYKYNILTNTYIQNTERAPISYLSCSSLNDNGMIYIFGGGQNGSLKAYEYNVGTGIFTKLPDMTYEVSYGSTNSVGNRVYVFGGRQYPKKVQVLEFPSVDFENKSIVLLNGSAYKTQLYSNDLVDNSVKYPFSNAWYYTTEGGLETDIPSYYGNGTQWINFKNPPSDVTNDEGENQEI